MLTKTVNDLRSSRQALFFGQRRSGNSPIKILYVHAEITRDCLFINVSKNLPLGNALPAFILPAALSEVITER